MVVTKPVTIDKDGLTIENGPKVTKDGINAGDKKITNVEDGTIAAGSKDAVMAVNCILQWKTSSHKASVLKQRMVNCEETSW